MKQHPWTTFYTDDGYARGKVLSDWIAVEVSTKAKEKVKQAG